jgi:2-C-methyl-D-erythritol 4-phosphate cytidylyltransferase
MDKIVLIVAGGTGTRMNAGIPKQFILLKGRPLIMHTLDIFRQFDPEILIRIVLPESHKSTWDKLCKKHNYKNQHEVGTGGETRFHSVKKNLSFVPDDCLIGIHDGVRPLVSLRTIERCYNTAMEQGNAVPCLDIPETLRRLDPQGTVQVDRTNYRQIQTPQVFRGSILKAAYLQEYNEGFTDDAGVVESAGHTIHLVDGNRENIKITYSNDLKIAEALIGRIK